MGNSHAHHHHHDHATVDTGPMTRAFGLGILLNAIFVVVEAFAGFSMNSLGLLADAGHNLSDVAALILAWLSTNLTKRKSFGRFTYGYKRLSILITFINNLLLLMAIGVIAWEAILRFKNPAPLNGNSVALVALIGIFVNAYTAYLFHKGNKKDLNIRSAYQHMAIDALTSLGVVIAGLFIHFTGAQWLDPLISILIVIIILFSSWNFFRETAFIIIDAAPLTVNIEKVKHMILHTSGVKSMHDLHIWKISTHQTALTAHLLIQDGTDQKKILDDLHHELVHHYDISHITIQLETGMPCEIKDC